MNAADSDEVDVLDPAGDAIEDTTCDIVEAIVVRAASDPEACALIDMGVSINYRELLADADRLAGELCRCSVGPGDLVAICLPRGARAVVAVLAALRVGAGYVPLDAATPAARLAGMLAATKPTVTLVDTATRDLLPDCGGTIVCDLDNRRDITDFGGPGPDRPATRRTEPEDPAYVVFTSGSTGQPKGVVVPRRAVCAFCVAARERYGITRGDRVLQFASLGFDASVDEILLPLSVGATVVFRDEEMLSRPDLFLRRCGEWGITVVGPPTAYWHELLAAVEHGDAVMPPSIRLVIIGGEAVHAAAVQRWRGVVGSDVRLLNCYGPTESTVVALTADLTEWDGVDPVPIGHPLPGVLADVRDTDGEPAGPTGELWLGGPGIATGYLGAPEHTAARFRTALDRDGVGTRWYRTGDVVARLPDGAFAFLHRLDRQVQVRGFRVEIGEVEAALRDVPGIREAVVLAERSGPTTALVAHLLRQRPDAPGAAAVRAGLARRVPASMVPTTITFHPMFPRNEHGKVDRDALRDAHPAAPLPGGVGHPVTALFADVLGHTQIRADDELTELGADSLAAVRILTRLRAEHGAALTLTQLYAAGTPAAVGELVSAADPAPTATDVPASIGEGTHELTGLQRDYWLCELLNPDLGIYTLCVRFRLTRPVDRDDMGDALALLLRRHPVLGARFPERDGRPVLLIDGTGTIPLTEDAHPGPLNLADGPVVRAVLGSSGQELTVFAHHVVFDGWSVGVFARDLGECLTNPDITAFAAGLPYYAGPPDGASHAADATYWRERLSGIGPVVGLPTDRPRPQHPTFAADRVERMLDPEEVQHWQQFGQSRRASLFMVVLSAVQALLARSTGATDITVLAPVANRGTAHLEDAVGALLNTLPLRADVSGNPGFAALVDRVRDRTIADLDHQRLPLPDIIAAAGRTADPGENPFGAVLLTVHNTPYGHNGLVRYVGEVAAPAVTVDVAIALDTTDTGPQLSLTARTELFDRDRVEDFLEALLAVLRAGAAEPEVPLHRLPLLAAAQRHGVVHEINDVRTCPPQHRVVHRYFEEFAAATPHAAALTADGVTIDYAELDTRANRLAHHLLGQSSAGPVAIALPRGIDLFVSIWAVLKTGCAWVPLDLDHPAARQRHVLTDSGAKSLLTHQAVDVVAGAVADGCTVLLLDAHADRIAAHAATPPAVNVRPSDPAYVLYTSGSTGLPNAVVVTHDNLTHAVEMWREFYGLLPEWTHQQVASVAFDMFVGETMRALCSGGRLVVVPRETALQPEALLTLMRRQRVACTELVPSMLRRLLAVLAVGEPLPEVALLIGGGEAWPAAEYRRARELVGPSARVVNSYGVAEVTVDSVAFEGPLPADATSVPIGRPLPNQRAYVLDAHQQPVPPGLVGELYLGGSGVARGYHGRPELTRERFLDDPSVPGARMFRTGDAARLHRSGVVEYLGRLDDQVKVHGHRVELGEVEAALRDLPDVVDAAAALRAGDLMGYVVLSAGSTGAGAGVRAELATRLPAAMMPIQVLVLPALPVNPSGKLDRKALPDRPGVSTAMVDLPSTPTERRIAAVWAEQLGLDPAMIAADTTFAQLGGDSFAAVRMAGAVSEQLGLVEVYRYPTVRALAARLDEVERCVHTDAQATDGGTLLHRLTSGPADPASGGVTVVGLPFAGGSAASFAPLAEALPVNWALLAVELPGHEISRPDEPLASLVDVVERVLDELAEIEGPILVYGQCVGTAPALELARRVPERGIDLVGVGLGALFPTARLPGRIFDRLHRLLPTDSLLGNRGYLDYLRARGGFTDVGTGEQARFVLRNVRHDTREAEEYFTADAAGSAGRAGPVLDVPILSVVGERDKVTELHHERYMEWAPFSPCVELAVVDRGGHFFIKHQASELAGLLVDAADRWRSPGASGGQPPDPNVTATEVEATSCGAAPEDGRARPARMPGVPRAAPEPSLRRFSVVAAGQIVSMIGSGISTLVMGIWALAETGDIGLFGLLSAIGVLPGILALPWSGAVADRFDRRHVMIAGNAVSAAAMSMLALLVALGGMRIWHVAVALSLTSLASAFQRPAYLAAVAQLVPKRFLGHIAGISQLGVTLGQVVGPLLGAGLLVMLGVGGVLLVEATGFVVGLLTLLAVRFPNRAFKRREESLGIEIARGWRYVNRRAGLRSGLWFFVVDHALYTVGFTVITPLLLAEQGPVALGVVLSAGGVGGLLGSVTMSLWGGTRRRTNGMIIAMGIGGLALLLVGVAGSSLLAAAGMFVLLFTEAIIDGSWIAVLSTKVDPQLLGRVMAIFTTLPLVTVPLGFLVVVPLADATVVPMLADPSSMSWLPAELFGQDSSRGPALLVVVSGATLVLWSVRGWFNRRLRFVEDELGDAQPGAKIFDRDVEQRRADALV